MSDEELVLRREPGLMELVQQIITSPNAKDQVEVVKAMLDLKERLEDRAAEKAFGKALHDMQARIEPITKDGEIIVKGVVRSRYAKSDSMDDVIRPLMDEYGFAFTMSVGDIVNDNMRQYLGTLMHEQGHKELYTLPLPLDENPFRSAVQSHGATITYARREFYKMIFKIVERNMDDPQIVEPISDEEAEKLNTKIQDTKSSLKAFCKYFLISSVKELKKADLARAHEMLDQKTARQKEAVQKEEKEADERQTGQL